MQKVVGSNPISRFPLQSQIRHRPVSRRGPIVAQTSAQNAGEPAEGALLTRLAPSLSGSLRTDGSLYDLKVWVLKEPGSR
jgi:hypothetical protein